MERKHLAYLSFAISLATLVYIFMDYFGLVRQVNLRVKDPEHFAEHYSALPQADEGKRVVISWKLTDRFSRAFLNSLLDQTVKVNSLSVYTDSQSPPVPPWLGLYANVYDHSAGSTSGLTGPAGEGGYTPEIAVAMAKEREAGSKILVVDDSVIYPENWVESMVDHANANPESVVYSGLKIKPKGVCLSTEFQDLETVASMSDCLSSKRSVTKCKTA